MAKITYKYKGMNVTIEKPHEYYFARVDGENIASGRNLERVKRSVKEYIDIMAIPLPTRPKRRA